MTSRCVPAGGQRPESLDAKPAARDQLAALPGCLSAGPLLPVTPSPADDVELAARLGIDIERIAVLRRRPGVALVALLDGSAPVAFGAFDPAFPGIYPACVASPDVARSLLEACRPHARHDHANVTVEGNRALYAALSAAGAELRHALYRMGASI